MRTAKGKRVKTFGLTVVVEDGKFEKALRQFKRKVEDSGLIKEVKDRREYIKPSIKRKLSRNAAKKRWQKKISQDRLPDRLY